MGKTLLKEQHPLGTQCSTRWCNNGLCGGVATAKWLNDLGDDDDLYIEAEGHEMTVGQVRKNWLHGNSHVMPAEQDWIRTCETCGGTGKVTKDSTDEVEIVKQALEYYQSTGRGTKAKRALVAIRRLHDGKEAE